MHGHEVEQNWSEKYTCAVGDNPPYIAKPKEKPITVSSCFDENRDHDLYTHRSIYGIIIFLNKTSVKSYRKNQGTVEKSIFGS